MAPHLKRKTVSGFDPDSSEQVWEAVTVLRSKLSDMTKFARVITGNPNLTVDITTGVPHTMGNKVFIRPPLGLGAKHEHQRSMCGQRDLSGRQMCRACQVREVIDFYLFHELAHVICKTQDRVGSKEFQTARREALRLHPEGCPHNKEVIKDLDHARAFGCDSMSLGGIFNKWLPTIINVLEDARVNENTFVSRPGLRRVFEMNLERLLTEGTEVGVDKTASWSDSPINSQFMIGLQIQASGASFEGAFDASVIEALRDPELTVLCGRVLQLDSVFQVFNLALEVHKRAQELGFCELDPCTVEDEAPDIGSLGTPGGEDSASEAGSGGDGESADDAEGDSPDRSGNPGAADKGGESEGSPDSEGSGEGSGNAESADAEPSGSGNDSSSSEQSSSAPSPGVGDDGEAGTDRGEPECRGTDSSSEDSSGEANEPGSTLPDSSDESGGQEAAGGTGNQADGSSADGSNYPVVQPDRQESGKGTRQTGDTDAGISGSENEESEGSGEVDAGSESSNLPAPGNDREADASADTGDDAGISGSSGEVGASEWLDQHSPTDTVGTAESGEDKGDPDGQGVQSESLEGSNEIESERASNSDETSDSSDPANPWDVENHEERHVTGDPFDGSNGSIGPSTPEPMVPGTPDDAARDVSKFLMHGSEGQAGLLDVMAAEDSNKAEHGDAENLIGLPLDDAEYADLYEGLLALALGQVGIFDGPSENVATTEIAEFPMRGIRWQPEYTCEALKISQADLPTAFAPAETLIGSALLHARTVFDANKRSHRDTNRRSGKVNTRVLGRRAPVGDDRLFAKKVVPKKRDYFLVLGGDASGSTDRYERNAKIKRSIHAQAEVLHRLNLSWAGYMHSAYWSSLTDFRAAGSRKLSMAGGHLIWNYLLPFKEEHESWNDHTKTKLASVNPISQNLDGHTLEAYRKIAMRNAATDRIVVYYTDGEMPAANKDEELEILYREIDLYKKYSIDLVCVGIQTDSPLKYGLPTVRVDSDEDIVKVIKFLDEILTKRNR